jgi:hypothetical protein
LEQTRNLRCAPVDDRIQAADIVRELSAGRPIGCQIEWTSGEPLTHAVAIIGYRNDGVHEDLTIGDPAPDDNPSDPVPPALVPLASFPGSYKNGALWSRTFFTTSGQPAA